MAEKHLSKRFGFRVLMTKSAATSVLLAAFSAHVLTGCSRSDTLGAEPVKVKPSGQYLQTVQPIFDDSCVFCHGSARADFGIDLSSYAATMTGDKNGDPIVVPFDRLGSSLYRSVLSDFMPIGISHLSADQKEAIGAWIDAGAPAPNSDPVTQPAARSSFFVKKVMPIFTRACIACHGATRQDFGIDLHDYASTMTGDAYGNPTVVAYDRPGSSLYRSVATGFMPIGTTALPAEEVAIIGQWIDLGLPSPLPFLTNGGMAAATDSVAYSYIFEALGGAEPITYALAGTSEPLPDGLTLSAEGVVSGTPVSASRAEPYKIQLVLTDADGEVGEDEATLTVYSAIPTIVSLNPIAAQEGVAYSTTLQATGGQAPYTWSLVSGSLPSGLSLAADGTIGGTPAAGASATSPYTFTVQVVESIADESATAQITLAVNPPHTVLFASEVYPLLTPCGAACHKTNGVDGGLTIFNAAAATLAELKETSVAAAPAARVVAGDTNSLLLQRLDMAPSNPLAMPPGGPQMSAEDRNIIRTWVLQGAQDN